MSAAVGHRHDRADRGAGTLVGIGDAATTATFCVPRTMSVRGTAPSGAIAERNGAAEVIGGEPVETDTIDR